MDTHACKSPVHTHRHAAVTLAHLARANSPKYSVIANMAGCHPKESFRTLVGKKNTRRKYL